MKKQKNKACFLDRDGVVIEERNYLNSSVNVKVFPETIEAFKILREDGFKLIVITNQGGVAKGYYAEESIHEVHLEISRQLAEFGLKIDKYYYCPHHPEGTVEKYSFECSCRKPFPGMILNAIKDFNIDPKASFMIGDKLTDIEAANNAGCAGILVKTGHGLEYIEKAEKENIVVADNILEAVKLFCRDATSCVSEC